MKKLIVIVILMLLFVMAATVNAGNEMYGGSKINEAYGSLRIGYNNFTDATAPAQIGAYGARRWRNVPFTTVEYFDSAAEWTDYNSTDADNTSEVVTSVNATLSSVKLTGAGGDAEMFMTKAGGGYGKLHNSHLLFRYCIHDGTGTADPAQITAITVRLSDAGFSNFISHNVYSGSAGDNYPGWHQIVLSIDNLGMGAGSRATLYDNFDTIRCVVTTTGASTATCSVSFDLVAVFPALRKPQYLFTFDDGKATDYAYASYLHSKGLRGTFYVHGSWIGESGYLTMEQLHRMQDMGHLIANHGWTAFDWQNDPVSDEQLREEVTRTTELLCANGFSRGSRIFALPSGSQALPEGSWDKYYKYWDNIRITGTCASLVPGVLYTGMLGTDSFDSTTNAASALAAAITGNTAVASGWHTANAPASFTFANWKTHVDNVLAQVQAGNIDVITVDEFMYRTDEYTYDYAVENSIGLLSSTPTVDLNAAVDTETLLYVVPPNKSAIVTHVVIHTLSANAASAVVTFGETGATCDEYLGNQTLSNLNGTSKYGVLMPVPNATPVGSVILDAGDEFGIEITTAAGGAATCTVDVFGYLQ